MNAQKEQEFDVFEKLAHALASWHIDISDAPQNVWMKKYDFKLQTSQHLQSTVTWLEWKKGHNYAEGFKAKFQELYRDVDKFYEKLQKGKLDKKEIFHEQIPLLEDKAKQLADYVLQVKKYLGQNGGRVQEQEAAFSEREKESWLWKLYKKTLKVIFDVILERLWPK